MNTREKGSVLLVGDDKGVEALREEGLENSGVARLLELHMVPRRPDRIVPPRPFLVDSPHELGHPRPKGKERVALGAVEGGDLLPDLRSLLLSSTNLVLDRMKPVDRLAVPLEQILEVVARLHLVGTNLGDPVVQEGDLVEDGLLLGFDVAVKLLLLVGHLLILLLESSAHAGDGGVGLALLVLLV